MIAIHNKCFKDYVTVNGISYDITTYVGGKHSPWGIPWVIWINRYDSCYTHEIEITEHTIEAAEEARKRAI